MIDNAQKHLKLPILSSILKNAQLRYVNLDQLIADSKSNRSSKHDAFLSCAYHDSIDLLLVHKGEIVNAIRFADSDRYVVSINEALTRARKVKSALLNYEKTEIHVHYLVLSTVCFLPFIRNLQSKSLKYKEFLKVLHEKKWSGFIEFGTPYELNFLTISEGQPQKLFLTESIMTAYGKKIISRLGEIMCERSHILSAYELVTSKALFSQVSPSQIALFSQIFLEIFHSLQAEIGKMSTLEMFQLARSEIISEYPLLTKTTIDLNGKLIYNGIAEARTFTNTLSAWLQVCIVKTTATTRIEPVRIVLNVVRPYDVTLHALGFYTYCPILKKGT